MNPGYSDGLRGYSYTQQTISLKGMGDRVLHEARREYRLLFSHDQEQS